MVRVWGNQHGSGVVFIGKHAKMLLWVSKKMGMSPQAAFKKILKETIATF